MSYVFPLLWAGFAVGTFFGLSIDWFLSSRENTYQKLLRETRSIANTKDGIVTLADLAFNAGVAPNKCRKFLERLAIQLDADVEVTEAGKIFYRFPTAEIIEYKKLKG